MEELQKIHSELRKSCYFYYEKSENIMSDYEFDMLQKKYNKLCNKYAIPIKNRITNFVGFDIMMPMVVTI